MRAAARHQLVESVDLGCRRSTERLICHRITHQLEDMMEPQNGGSDDVRGYCASLVKAAPELLVALAETATSPLPSGDILTCNDPSQHLNHISLDRGVAR